ncbi:MAG: protein adenylyltransferase SelO family protein, partial [Flavobacteriales bacterium]
MNFKQATYLNLSRDFYSKLSIKPFDNANVIQWNFALTKELEIPEGFGEDILSFLKGKQSEYFKHVFAQAYAGHQFGHFTMLGDGRTAVLGEWVGNQEAYEIQLKGSGPTPYSRRGDGKANLRAMLREYLISEAMHGLGISTSRSLAIYDSGEKIQRNALEDGAILVRIMKSHLRVGTFEYARYFLDHRALVQLFDFCVDRFYPEVKQEENPVLSFISRVAEKQFDLIAHWMRVGFIHGVMNTDNTAISGETFDYGPCAFMNRYDPMTVYSSIDSQGRYAFGNQPNCIQW